MNIRISAIAALVAAMAFGSQANATTVRFQFNGGPYSSAGFFTITPNVAPADPNPNCATTPGISCRTDPPGAYAITGITGRFTDLSNGIVNAAITGIVPINPANERDSTFDPLVPSSLSFIDYAPGSALTYNNLFFPTGSPIDCDFLYAGTFVDVFGVAFTVNGGYTVDLWGDGDMNGPGTTTYGVGVTDGTKLLSYQFAGVNATAAEPSSLALLGAGLFGVLGWWKRSKRTAEGAAALG